jgi:hypothetical protein
MKILSKKEALKNELLSTKEKDKEVTLLPRNYLSLLHYRINQKLKSLNEQEVFRFINKDIRVKFLLNPKAENIEYRKLDGKDVLSYKEKLYLGSVYPEEITIYNDTYMDMKISLLKALIDPSSYEIDINSRLYDDSEDKHSTSTIKNASIYQSSFAEPAIFYNEYMVKWKYKIIECDDDFFVPYIKEQDNHIIDELVYLTTGSKKKSYQNKVYIESKVDKLKSTISTMTPEEKTELLKQLQG